MLNMSCHVMLYNMPHVTLCYITCVMLCYITCIMLCYITCVMLYCCEGRKLDNSLGYYVTFVK